MVIIETKKEDVSLVVKANTELTYVALEDVNSPVRMKYNQKLYCGRLTGRGA